MAHNIEIINGVASFAESRKNDKAWHGLGQIFDRPMTVTEALTNSHADYEVGLQNIVAITPEIAEAMANGSVPSDLLLEALVGGKKATMRLDRNIPLGIVGDNYGVVQNKDAFQFIDTLCTGGITDHAPIIECAGVLGQGERIFITAKFPEDIILDNKGNDRVEMYVVFTTSHDGLGAVTAMVTPIRVVCNNTLNLAMGHNSGRLSFRHTSGIMNRLDLMSKENQQFAYRTLNLFDVYKNSLESKFAELQNKKLLSGQVENILANLVLSDESLDIYKQTNNVYHEDIPTRSKNLFDNLLDNVESGIGQEYGESGTGMWLINGVTTFYQNAMNYRNDEKKFNSLMDGHARAKLQKAYELVAAA